MEQWEQWQMAEKAALRQKQAQDLDAISCPTCGSEWFEQAKYIRVKSDHLVIIGQEVPGVEPGLPSYILLRCVHCSNLLQPRIQGVTYGQDIASKAYSSFLDTAEGKFDSRTKNNTEKEKVTALEKKMVELEEKLSALQSKK